MRKVSGNHRGQSRFSSRDAINNLSPGRTLTTKIVNKPTPLLKSRLSQFFPQSKRFAAIFAPL
jgi:hypothetical protein